MPRGETIGHGAATVSSAPLASHRWRSCVFRGRTFRPRGMIGEAGLRSVPAAPPAGLLGSRRGEGGKEGEGERGRGGERERGREGERERGREGEENGWASSAYVEDDDRRFAPHDRPPPRYWRQPFFMACTRSTSCSFLRRTPRKGSSFASRSFFTPVRSSTAIQSTSSLVEGFLRRRGVARSS